MVVEFEKQRPTRQKRSLTVLRKWLLIHSAQMSCGNTAAWGY